MTELTATASVRRMRLRRAFGLTAIVTVALLAVGWFADWPYLFMLVLWFICWLTLGHWWFCRNEWITQWHVRLIDYLYLSAAAGSIILAASQYHQERAQYIAMLDDVLVPPNKPALKEMLDHEQANYCTPPYDDFTPERYCRWTAGIYRFLDSTYGASDLEARIKEGHDIMEEEQWDSWWVTLKLYGTYAQDDGRRDIFDTNPTRRFLQMQRRSGLAVRTVVRSMEKIALAEFPSPAAVAKPKPEGLGQAIGGVGRYVVWPLLLIFALAIRFIKVTAEVSGWVK